jgi:LuxR family quorum-sensing system transcriptional regulator CciR
MGIFNVAAEFERRAEACMEEGELRSLLVDAAREIGFHHVAIVHSMSLRREDSNLISLDNYPEAWAEEFVGGELYLEDPVLHASQRTAKGFRWEDVARLVKIDARHSHVLERSQRYGMGLGFTVPANVPGEASGSCSFSVKRGRNLPEAAIRCAELIGIDAFDAARRLKGLPIVGGLIHLSRRERQCVRLLAAGKTDWEISVILGISDETVHRYVKSARAKYNVVTRTQLVIEALRDGQIHFDDSVQPSGLRPKTRPMR